MLHPCLMSTLCPPVFDNAFDKFSELPLSTVNLLLNRFYFLLYSICSHRESTEIQLWCFFILCECEVYLLILQSLCRWVKIWNIVVLSPSGMKILNYSGVRVQIAITRLAFWEDLNIEVSISSSCWTSHGYFWEHPQLLSAASAVHLTDPLWLHPVQCWGKSTPPSSNCKTANANTSPWICRGSKGK